MSESKSIDDNIDSDTSDYSYEEEPWEKEHRNMTADEIMNKIKEWLDENHALEDENDKLKREAIDYRMQISDLESQVYHSRLQYLELKEVYEKLKCEYDIAQQRIKELYKLVYKTDDKNTSITSD